jgi:Spy/CpxP family protein refolding chaperone
MNIPNFKILFAVSSLVFSTAIYSTSAVSHQIDHDSFTPGMGHMPMMGASQMGMMDHIPMMRDGNRGMMSHMSGMGECYKGAMEISGELGLSDQQQQKVNDIKYELHKKHWTIMGRMIDQQSALQKAYASERPDPKTVGAVYGQIFELKREMIEVELEARIKIKDTLTEDQRNQVKKYHSDHGGMMRGHGMMHGYGTQSN